MIENNVSLVSSAAAEDLYSGVVETSATVGTRVVTPRIRCPECGQLYKERGLSLHMRRAHNTVLPPRSLAKRRWTETELYMLALEEIRLLETNPRRDINTLLAAKFPHRTRDSIKSQRRATSLRYRNALQLAENARRRGGTPGVLSQAQGETGNAGARIEPPVSSPNRDGRASIPLLPSQAQAERATEPSAEAETETGNTPGVDHSARGAWRTRLAAAISASSSQLPGINVEEFLDPQASKPEVRAMVDSAYDTWLPAREARIRRGPARTRSGSGKGRPKPSKRELRRRNFARLQRLFKRSRGRAAEAVLDNSWETLADDSPVVSLTDREASF